MDFTVSQTMRIVQLSITQIFDASETDLEARGPSVVFYNDIVYLSVYFVRPILGSNEFADSRSRYANMKSRPPEFLLWQADSPRPKYCRGTRANPTTYFIVSWVLPLLFKICSLLHAMLLSSQVGPNRVPSLNFCYHRRRPRVCSWSNEAESLGGC